MFNRYYNRQPYNRSNGRKDIMIKEVHTARLNGWLTISADHYISEKHSERLQGNALGTVGILTKETVTDVLLGDCFGSVGVIISEQHKTKLESDAYLGLTAYLKENQSTKLTSKAYLGLDVYNTETVSTALNGKAYLGLTVYEEGLHYQVLNGYLSVVDIVEYITQITGAIPPGGTLVIDSSNFTAILNNKNVIHWHKGDWIYAEPGTVDISLSASGIQKYDWEVFYIAKYL